MAKVLRIVCTILCALCVLAVFPVGTFLDFGYAAIIAFIAGAFFGLMLIFKKWQERGEQGPPAPKADFFNPQTKEEKEEK